MAQAERYYRTNRSYQVYGNAAVRPEPDRRRREREEREYREALLRKVREEEAGERRQLRDYSLPQIAVLTAALGVIALLLAVFMIQLSGNYRLKTDIENGKKTYQALVRDNALLQDKIDRQTDYAAVYHYAVETLGMQAPESQQIVYYQRSSGEFVECRGTIPNE